MAENVCICNTLSWNIDRFVRFESSNSCKHRYAYTEYRIDFRAIKSQLNLSKTKRAYLRFVSFTEKAEELLLHVKKQFSRSLEPSLLCFLGSGIKPEKTVIWLSFQFCDFVPLISEYIEKSQIFPSRKQIQSRMAQVREITQTLKYQTDLSF